MGKEAKRRWGSFAVTYGRERTKDGLCEFVGLRISNEEEHEGGVETVFRFERQADFGGAHILLADVILVALLLSRLELRLSPHFALILQVLLLLIPTLYHARLTVSVRRLNLPAPLPLMGIGY